MHRQQDDLLRLLLFFFKVRKVRYKNSSLSIILGRGQSFGPLDLIVCMIFSAIFIVIC
jgi:hypothetical protein